MSKLFTTLFTLLSFTAFAQKNFVEGSISMNDGLSIKGLIDYQEWMFNPKQVKFKKNENAEVQIYYPSTIKGFRIDYKNEEYQSAWIAVNYPKKDINTESTIELDSKGDIVFKMPLKSDYVFLQTLVKGKINLFTLADAKKGSHYFIQKDDGKIEELLTLITRVPPTIDVKDKKYRKVQYVMDRPNFNVNFNVNGQGREGGYYLVIFEAYKMQLNQLMKEVKSLQSTIDYLNFPFDLINLVASYNHKMGDRGYVKKRDKGEQYFRLYGGIAQPIFMFKDAFHTTSKTVNGNLAPAGGLGFDFSIPRSLNKLSIGFELNFINSIANYDEVYTDLLSPIPVRTINYKMALNGARFNALLKYDVYKAALTPYVTAGLGRSFYLKNEYDASERETWNGLKPLSKKELTGLGGIGVKRKNFFIESRYEVGTDINRNTANYEFNRSEDLKMNRFSIVVGWAIKL